MVLGTVRQIWNNEINMRCKDQRGGQGDVRHRLGWGAAVEDARWCCRRRECGGSEPQATEEKDPHSGFLCLGTWEERWGPLWSRMWWAPESQPCSAGVGREKLETQKQLLT